MRFFTNFKFWRLRRKDREVYDILDTKLSACVGEAKSLGNGFRDIVGIPKLSSGTFDITQNIEVLNAAYCDLEKKAGAKLAQYNVYVDKFLEADEDYHDLIRLEEEILQKEEQNNKNTHNEK